MARLLQINAAYRTATQKSNKQQQSRTAVQNSSPKQQSKQIGCCPLNEESWQGLSRNPAKTHPLPLLHPFATSVSLSSVLQQALENPGNMPMTSQVQSEENLHCLRNLHRPGSVPVATATHLNQRTARQHGPACSNSTAVEFRYVQTQVSSFTSRASGGYLDLQATFSQIPIDILHHFAAPKANFHNSFYCLTALLPYSNICFEHLVKVPDKPASSSMLCPKFLSS